MNMSTIMVFNIKVVVAITFLNEHICDVSFSRTRAVVTAMLNTTLLVLLRWIDVLSQVC